MCSTARCLTNQIVMLKLCRMLLYFPDSSSLSSPLPGRADAWGIGTRLCMCVYLCAYLCMCACVLVCMCVGSTGGLVVGTPVYNTTGCEIEPQQCRCFFPSPPPAHPTVKWVPSLYKARVDKTTDCGNYNILTSGGPGGTLCAHTTNTGATVSAPANTWPGFRS